MENRNYSVVYRIMHWAIAGCLLFILLTIFLRLNWMNKDHVAGIIQVYLAKTNQSLSQEQVIKLAKQIRKPMWDWHIYIGYVLVGLYGIRMLLPFFGQMHFSNPFTQGLSVKVKFQYWAYWIFYGCLAISLFTGAMIELGSKNLKEPMEEVHVLSIYYLLAFIVIHFSGVLWAEFSNQQGIVSKIISGKTQVSSNDNKKS